MMEKQKKMKKKYSTSNKKVVKRKKDSDESVTQKIGQISNIIRKKLVSLKLGKDVEAEMLSRLYKPIKDPLDEIAKKSNKTAMTTAEMAINTDVIKTEKKPEVTFIPEVNVISTPSPLPPQNIHDDDDDESEEEEDINVESEACEEYLEQYPPLARYYIEKYFTDRGAIDKSYGLQYNSRLSERLSILQ